MTEKTGALYELTADLISTKEVAELLHVKMQTVYMWRAKENFPQQVYKNHFSQKEVVAWLKARGEKKNG